MVGMPLPAHAWFSANGQLSAAHHLKAIEIELHNMFAVWASEEEEEEEHSQYVCPHEMDTRNSARCWQSCRVPAHQPTAKDNLIHSGRPNGLVSDLAKADSYRAASNTSRNSLP